MSSPRIKASAGGKARAVGDTKLRRFGKLLPLPDEEAHHGILRTLAAQQSNVRARSRTSARSWRAATCTALAN